MDVIKDFMSKPVLSVTIQASAEETAKEMDQKSVSCLLARLKPEDRVVGAEIVHPGNMLLTITSNGYGKRTQLEEYPVQGRGGLGVMTIRCNEKIGSVIGIQQVTENDQLLVITSDGNIS